MTDTSAVTDTPIVRVLKGERIWPPPVWMMRQAGRFLPSYRAIREKYDFQTMYRTPEIAAEVTLLPLQEFPLDGAILFSDILVLPEAMGLQLHFHEGTGPIFSDPITDSEKLALLTTEGLQEKLAFVGQTLELLRQQLPPQVTLIGFSGAPWTLAAYMVEGQGSRHFSRLKSLAYSNTPWLEELLELLAKAVAEYLTFQYKKGAQVVQLFDTWAGLLDEEGFLRWVLPYVEKVLQQLPQELPVIYFAKGCSPYLKHLHRLKRVGLGLDWNAPWREVRHLFPLRPLQGNLDPVALLTSEEVIRQKTEQMLEHLGPPLIANLGHGILPTTPVENARAFVNAVKGVSP